MNRLLGVAVSITAMGVLMLAAGAPADAAGGVETPQIVVGQTPPVAAWDYEYLFQPGTSDAAALDMPYGSSCSSKDQIYQVGVWDAQNGYSGIALDAGLAATFPNLLNANGQGYFFPNQSSGNVDSWLGPMVNCYEQGFTSVNSNGGAVYLGFNNQGAASTSGSYVGNWVFTNGLNGAWVDFEGAWSSPQGILNALSAYHSQNAGGNWYDAQWRESYWGSGSPDLQTYISQVDQDYYGGQQLNFIGPQNYAESMNACADYWIQNSNCSGTVWGNYVGGVTVAAVNSYGYSPNQQWVNYASLPYPNVGNTAVMVVDATGNSNSSGWQNW